MSENTPLSSKTLLHPMPPRRKRSKLSTADCLKVLKEFACKVDRMKETSQDFEHPSGIAPPDRLTVAFSVVGSFGVATDLFEAVRVLAGYKLPRQGK